jgi:PTH1 family peptidyl-tRNA hydrolase
VAGADIYLVKPLTYMNNSGVMISQFLEYFKIPAQSLLVCFDDISMDVGKIRIRKSGSSGGHQGMASVIERAGSEDIPRLKLGTGPQLPGQDSLHLVLSRFSKAEQAAVGEAVVRAGDAILAVIEQGLEPAMNAYNGAK